ncbi:putative alpha-N-acetylglucosaminidase [Aspergillus ellipticus CBS 707.79]|uniref:Putative alpha-N-acetylglucosaminidase n=1 Tax=Aspergillus ellipticus CBS 707.79 TaxID=1448320 RepID=A0A319DMD1_9EURO|nr:putative alpha-N-acetylglucosaminidase [Aspergillus ellipticus CBS 707.79]
MPLLSTVLLAATAVCQSTQGLSGLIERRIPAHVDSFQFHLANLSGHDAYRVSTPGNGTVIVEGNSISGMSQGLHRYLSDIVHVDIYWYIGSRLHLAPAVLPNISAPLTGSSLVPYRYHFNTVTFSYTTAFWTWEEWEDQLDWMALRGINLPLAWVGVEKIIYEVFQDIGLDEADILSYLSGPAFQAWNRLGNIQGSWDGQLPTTWIDAQFSLQKQIVSRMVELGMTPILPAFTGFVPRSFSSVIPGANVVNGSQWSGFPTEYTNVSFLEPSDSHFSEIQKSFITKQQAAYGNVSHIYTLDQFNENDPASGDEAYLRNITADTWQGLKSADSDAIWMMQGWLFYSNSAFWTDARISAYLSGVTVDTDMIILDLFSESEPQWQRTNSYYGKLWIWCQLHDYGGNMGIYGQILNVTENPVAALANSSSLVGFGLTMEGQEGNEVMYDLLLDQAWSEEPIDTEVYFHDWVTARYASNAIPESLYHAWELLRESAYNNTDLTSAAVSKSIYELQPGTTDLVNVTGHHPTTVNYDPAIMVQAWRSAYSAAETEPSLWHNPAYQYDLVDFTRQVVANAFIPLYNTVLDEWNSTTSDLNSSARLTNSSVSTLPALLSVVNKVLSTNEHFRLSTWTSSARSLALNSSQEGFYNYNARNQITLWGPTGQIHDYASKQWSGLVETFYKPRWEIFLNYLLDTSPRAYNPTALDDELLQFELAWQWEADGEQEERRDLWTVLAEVVEEWPSVFG